MRKYDDPVEVCRGMVRGVEGPTEFGWRDQWWQIEDVLGRWLETGAWWESLAAPAETGTADPVREVGPGNTDLLAERVVWRVAARRSVGVRQGSPGVFELQWNAADNGWRLVACLD